jgi:hypothetical protein
VSFGLGPTGSGLGPLGRAWTHWATVGFIGLLGLDFNLFLVIGLMILDLDCKWAFEAGLFSWVSKELFLGFWGLVVGLHKIYF